VWGRDWRLEPSGMAQMESVVLGLDVGGWASRRVMIGVWVIA
jgi:hypothetical protein